MRSTSLALLAGLAVALTACEGGGDPVEQAKQDALTANRAAAHPIDPALLADGTQGAVAATTSPADQAYVTAMIEHHRAAMTTAQTALRQSQDAEIRRLAQSAIDSRAREIAELQAWKPVGG